MELKYEIKIKGPIAEGKAPEIAHRKFNAAMWEAVAFLETKVKEYLPSEVDGIKRGVGVYGDQGGLRSTIAGEVQKVSALMITGIVGHMSAYGDVIEKGRRANKGMPPKGALIRWMEVKLGMSTAEAEKKEFGLRRAIGKKGFPGVKMFERAFNDHEKTVLAIFERYGLEVAKAI